MKENETSMVYKIILPLYLVHLTFFPKIQIKDVVGRWYSMVQDHRLKEEAIKKYTIKKVEQIQDSEPLTHLKHKEFKPRRWSQVRS